MKFLQFLIIACFVFAGFAEEAVPPKRGPGGKGNPGFKRPPGNKGPPKAPPKAEPEIAPSPNLHILMDASFNELIEKNDVSFVKFYAPWCGHCKKLAPVWNQLADSMKPETGIAIAKFDCTNESNGVQQTPKNLEVKGFPTLMLFVKGNTTGIKYTGSRDLDSLEDFVLGYKGGPKDRGSVHKVTKIAKDAFFKFVKYFKLDRFISDVIKHTQKDPTLPIIFMLIGFLLAKFLFFLFPGRPDRKQIEEQKTFIRKSIASRTASDKAPKESDKSGKAAEKEE